MDSKEESCRRAQIRKRKKRRKRRKQMIRLMKIFIVLLFLVLTGLIVWNLFFAGPKVKKTLICEAGSTLPEAADYLKKEYKNVKILKEPDAEAMNHVGEHEVVLEVEGREVTSILKVEDTVKPSVTVDEHVTATPDGAEAAELLSSVEDATDVTVSYKKEPDFGSEELQEITILVTDEGGNETEVSAMLEIIFDTEAPVIEGVEELHVPAGTAVSYKRNVTVTDNKDEKPKLTVENDGVDLNTVGDYPIVYVAEDKAGNVTRIETVLHVEKPNVENATEELVNAEADKLLARITTEDMSQYDKAKAIFFWVHENIGYLDGSPKDDWVKGAYMGLVEHQGDCYVYFATAKCLLTRAGIKNMDIAKIPAETRHYWNLINLGDGWYHYDTTRRKDKTYFFYTSDAELMEYSRSHRDSHNYDPAQYPKIQ